MNNIENWKNEILIPEGIFHTVWKRQTNRGWKFIGD